VTAIERHLRSVHDEHHADVLLAIESGSRAWGFPSPDSDYDCRFIYARRTQDYLSLFPARDVIEEPFDRVLDIGGWDLAKALRLLLKGNAVVVEWLMSPRQAREFARNLNKYTRTYGRKTPALPGMQTPGADRSSTDLYPASAARLPRLGCRPIHQPQKWPRSLIRRKTASKTAGENIGLSTTKYMQDDRMNALPTLMTEEEVAQHLDMSARTVRRYCRTGRLLVIGARRRNTCMHGSSATKGNRSQRVAVATTAAFT